MTPCFALASLFAAVPQIWFVDASASGANDGSSWSSAFTDLRAALAQAQPGDELWVAEGVYTPGASAAASDSFFLESGVELYGGFAGTETTRAQRDWVAHPTVLSGDVGHDDVFGTPWYVGWSIGTSNSAHVVTANGVDATAVLDGFIVSGGALGPGGTPAGGWEMYGGGLMAISAAPTVRNCVFEHNLASFGSGAALCNVDSSPHVSECTFRENWVHLGNGAGVCNLGSSAPTIVDCRFEGNVITTYHGQTGQGCGISNDWNCPPMVVERCVFEHNSARQFYPSGSGFEIARGGALSAFGDGLTLRDCVFRSNDANAGGAVFLWGTSTVVNCLFTDNRVYNMVNGGATVGGVGSAVGAWVNAGDDIRVVSCSIVGNHVVGGEAGAVYAISYASASMRVQNSILWGNTAPATASVRQRSYKGWVELEHDCVEGLFAPDPSDPTPTPGEVPGCIDSDPQFVGHGAGNWRLGAGSPCIDAGSNFWLPGGTSTDLDGLTRVVQGASSLTVDMGAFEFGAGAPSPCLSLVRTPQAVSCFEGASPTFDVLVMGAGASYQWRKDGVPLSDGAHFDGTRGPIFTIIGATLADAGNYDVVITSGCNSITTPTAALSVAAVPLGAVFCSGDGIAVSCPCGNDKDPGEGCENSTGDGARLRGSGSRSVLLDDAQLTADALPAGVNVLLFLGDTRLNLGAGSPFKDGLLCTQPRKRFPLAASSSAGDRSWSNLAQSAPTHVQAGATLYFQVWYRDSQGPCGSGSNTSNAYEITFAP